MKRILCILACLTAWPAGLGAGENTDAALAWFAEAAKNDRKKAVILATLKGTGEAEVLPAFLALGSSESTKLRRVAPQAIMDLAQEAQAPPLLRPFLDDPDSGIRAETIIYLSQLDALQRQDLVKQLESDSEELRCIAGRCLVKIGEGELARAALEAMAYTGSDASAQADLPTRVMAAMALLAMGEDKYLKPLSDVLTAGRTPESVKILALEEAMDLEVTEADDIAQAVAEDPRNAARTRLQAYKVLLNIAPDGKTRLIKAILAADDLMVAHLLHLLVEGADETSHLRALGGKTGLLGTLARFELARAQGSSDEVARLAGVALELNQPVVLQYILGRARKDLRDKQPFTDAYDRPLLKLLESLHEAGTPRGPDVPVLQQTVAVLADVGTDPALIGLQQLFSRRYNAFQATAAAGLPRAETDTVTVVARHLLASPYEQIATYAAFTVGKFGREPAAEYLRKILDQKQRYRTSLRTLAAWYLIKIDDQTRYGAQAIGELLK